MVALKFTISIRQLRQGPLEKVSIAQSCGHGHYHDGHSSIVVSRSEEDGTRRRRCARGLRAGSSGNRHLVQHRGWDRSGRRVRYFVGALSSRILFHDLYFDSCR